MYAGKQQLPEQVAKPALRKKKKNETLLNSLAAIICDTTQQYKTNNLVAEASTKQ